MDTNVNISENSGAPVNYSFRIKDLFETLLCKIKDWCYNIFKCEKVTPSDVVQCIRHALGFKYDKVKGNLPVASNSVRGWW